MWITEFSGPSRATPEQIWPWYERVERWAIWDPSLRKSELVGPFAVGSRGRVKPRGGPSSAIVLTVVEPGRRFTATTGLLFTTVTFEHELQPTPRGTRITHRVCMSGALQPLVSRILGNTFARGLPLAVRSLAALAAETAPETLTAQAAGRASKQRADWPR
jgi:hypothetical protein